MTPTERTKITVIGAGNVGATSAMRILESDLGDVVLLDVAEGVAKGKAEDLMDAASLIGHGRRITGTADYEDTRDSDIIVVTAGFARKPGMSREDLLNKNATIIKDVTRKFMEFNKDPVVIVVTNPLDLMTYLTRETSSLDSKKVFGMAGCLDASRMNLMISRQLDKPLAGIASTVLGTHGETMVPAISKSEVSGMPLSDVADKNAIARIVSGTKARGAEIVSYLGTGSAFYAPSAGVFRMVNAVIRDTREIMQCSCMLNGEYGISGVYLGVPVRIGKSGIEEIIELELSGEEKALLEAASTSVRGQIEELSKKSL